MAVFLTTTQVAEMLSVSDQTVVNMCKSGELKHIKFGKRFLVDKAALEDRIGKSLEGGEEIMA